MCNGLYTYTCTHSNAGFEFFVDVTSRYELGARDSVHVAQREADEVVVGCILPDNIVLD